MGLQKAFLRVLQEHASDPWAARARRRAISRLVAATNRDLERMSWIGSSARICCFGCGHVHRGAPATGSGRRRRDLERHFLEKRAREAGGDPKRISPEFWGALLVTSGRERQGTSKRPGHAPGRRGNDTVLCPRHLRSTSEPPWPGGPWTGGGAAPTSTPWRNASSSPPRTYPTLKDFRSEALGRVEQRYLTELMRVSAGRIQRACALSGLSRARLSP